MAGLSGKLNLGFLSSIGQDGYVAFDIGSSSVKMVEAAVDKSGCRLLNAGLAPWSGTKQHGDGRALGGGNDPKAHPTARCKIE